MSTGNTSTLGRVFFRPSLSVCALCALMAGSAFGQSGGEESNQGAESDVQVTDYGTVDLAVQDTDLSQILQMLSIQSKKNIITSKSVSATVTANLYDVTFYEALDAILRVNGYGYIEEGNFIYIYTHAELEEIERARRQTESRIFDLEFLSASDAHELIIPLLSEDGQSSFRGDVEAGFKPEVSNGGADNYAFSAKIVVNDYPERLDAIAALLDDLDTSPKQVLVEATILQTTLNEDNAFGIDFTLLGSIDFPQLTNPLAAVTDLIAGTGRDEVIVREGPGGTITTTEIPYQQPDKATAITSTVGGTAGPGGLKVGVVRDDISIFLRVLDEVTDSTVLARPKILALNRQRAQVLVGTKVGYLSTTATETTTTQSVQFLDTGIQLIFRPFISKDGMIRLELAPSVSEAQLRNVTSAGGQAPVTIPDEVTNQVTTNVRVRDGQTLVLGGLFRESTRITRRQVPVLGDVPILGAAFRGQDDEIVRSEIIFLITPSVVKDEVLWEIGQDTLKQAEYVQVGARAGLLPFSRTKVTSNYNQQAVEAFNRGDMKMSHYYINNSLRLHPNQPEMTKLREQVTGARERAHERSILERMIRKQLGSATGGDNPDIAKLIPPVTTASTNPTFGRIERPKNYASKSEAPFSTPEDPTSDWTAEDWNSYERLLRSMYSGMGWTYFGSDIRFIRPEFPSSAPSTGVASGAESTSVPKEGSSSKAEYVSVPVDEENE